jgi:hypothetical protein
MVSALAHAYGLMGNRIKALSILDGLEEQSKRRYVSSYSRAVAYIGLDEKDQAFYWLEKALQERSVMLAWLKVGSEFDDLLADPRFRDLLRRVNFHRDIANAVSCKPQSHDGHIRSSSER